MCHVFKSAIVCSGVSCDDHSNALCFPAFRSSVLPQLKLVTNDCCEGLATECDSVARSVT